MSAAARGASPRIGGLLADVKHAWVILDVGSSYTKAGFASESEPRVVLPTLFTAPASQEASSSSLHNKQHTLNISPSLGMPLPSSWQWEEALETWLSTIFFTHLKVSPKDRRVLWIDAPWSLPSTYRASVLSVLLGRFHVPDVVLVPRSVAALAAVSHSSGLVLDVGGNSATAVPVLFGMPLGTALQSSPLGAQSLYRALQQSLLPQASALGASTFRPSLSSSARSPRTSMSHSRTASPRVSSARASSSTPRAPSTPSTSSPQLETSDSPNLTSSSPSAPVPDPSFSLTSTTLSRASSSSLSLSLSPAIFDELIERFCFVASRSHASKLAKAATEARKSTVFGSPAQPAAADASPVSGLRKSASRAAASAAAAAAVSGEPGAVAYHLGADASLYLNEAMRAGPAETLFDGDDEDVPSLVAIICQALLAAPLNERRALASNLVVVGGLSCLSGFMERLAQELADAMSPTGHFPTLAGLKSSVSLTNMTSSRAIAVWTGGSVLAQVPGVADGAITKQAWSNHGVDVLPQAETFALGPDLERLSV